MLKAQHATPIRERRSPRTWDQIWNAIGYFTAFNVGCIMVQATHILLWPLLYAAPTAYRAGIRYTKGAFGCLLVLMIQWFAPTSLHVTFETEGFGSFTVHEMENMAVKNPEGRVIGLRLPTKSVLIANHQIYADWIYHWCFLYMFRAHNGIFIVLKKSLKWLPIVGWGMQFFGFIFLSRRWESDKRSLSASLASIGKEAQTENIPLALVLYPEGTLVSEQTRPLSKKYADKMSKSDLVNLLLPRSTGLHHSLRSLSPRIPHLQLIDVTVVYPGIPPQGYGQDYYTLRSIFFDRIPPPAIHMHVRKFDVAKDVPLGDLSSANPKVVPSTTGTPVEIDIDEAERARFDDWLQRLWKEKDDSITEWYKTESFVSSEKTKLEVPVQLRHTREKLDAFCMFAPALVGYVWAACFSPKKSM